LIVELLWLDCSNRHGPPAQVLEECLQLLEVQEEKTRQDQTGLQLFFSDAVREDTDAGASP